jgi:hypothetical protein
MGAVGCPETSVHNYHLTLRNIPEECRFHLHHSGSLKSHIGLLVIRSVYILIKDVVTDLRARDSQVDIVTISQAGQPRNRGSILGNSKRFSVLPKFAVRLWSPPKLLFSCYQLQCFPVDKVAVA